MEEGRLERGGGRRGVGKRRWAKAMVLTLMAMVLTLMALVLTLMALVITLMALVTTLIRMALLLTLSCSYPVPDLM